MSTTRELQTVATELNLRSLVQDVMAESRSAEYADIAVEVLRRIAPEDFGAALKLALPAFVRTVNVSQRASAQEFSGRDDAVVVAPVPAARSWKVKAIRDRHQILLDSIYSTAEGNKRFGDFTYADIIFQASLLERQSGEMHAKAARLRDLAGVLVESGVERVRDLPADAFESVA